MLALLWLAKSPRSRLIPAHVLGAGIIYFVWSLSNSAFYFNRNMASAYVFMSFIIALAVGDLAGNALARRPLLRVGASLGMLSVFLASALSLADAMRPLRDVFFEQTAERARACDSIGAVGLAQAELRTLRKTAAGAVTAYPGIRAPFQFYKKPLPGWLARHFLTGKDPGPPLTEWFDNLRQHDCLVAYRRGHTKRITNYLALRHYRLHDRVGNRFFFVRKPGE